MDEQLNNLGANNNLKRHSSANVVAYVVVGVVLFIALIAGLYLTSQTQNIGKKAQTPNSCQGEDKVIAGVCPQGYVPIGTVNTGTQDGGRNTSDGQVIDVGSSQLCCQRQIQTPTSEPPTNAPPTDVPPTQAGPTKNQEQPTNIPVTQIPTLTDVPLCKQAPEFSVDIIINQCPRCLRDGTQQ